MSRKTEKVFCLLTKNQKKFLSFSFWVFCSNFSIQWNVSRWKQIDSLQPISRVRQFYSFTVFCFVWQWKWIEFDLKWFEMNEIPLSWRDSLRQSGFYRELQRLRFWCHTFIVPIRLPHISLHCASHSFFLLCENLFCATFPSRVEAIEMIFTPICNNFYDTCEWKTFLSTTFRLDEHILSSPVAGSRCSRSSCRLFGSSCWSVTCYVLRVECTHSTSVDGRFSSFLTDTDIHSILWIPSRYSIQCIDFVYWLEMCS